MLRFSIITPSYNQGQYIEQNIRSVLDQNYANFEHIIIDGGSTDNTIDILNKYPHLIWISEKDNGQADAVNKGLKLASGDLIGWINSDDFYEPGIFKDIATIFNDSNTPWIIGNLTFYYHETNENYLEESPTVTYENLINNPDIVRQQPAFFRKHLIDKCGRLDSTLHMVMDFDLWVRLSKESNPLMIKMNYAYFRFHGNQKTSYKNVFRQLLEIRLILKREDKCGFNYIRLLLKKFMHATKGIIKFNLISYGLFSSKYKYRPFRLPNNRHLT